MQIPEWIKPAVWGAVGGAAFIAIVGFSADWVVTSGTAADMAQAQSDQAVVAALTPICIAQFGAQTEALRTTHLAAIEEESSWKRSDYIEEHGWATMPGTGDANQDVAKACATKILEIAGG